MCADVEAVFAAYPPAQKESASCVTQVTGGTEQNREHRGCKTCIQQARDQMTQSTPIWLRREHASAYRALMLEAYERHPDAFTSSVAERAAQPLAWWEARLVEDPQASDVVFGDFAEGGLNGVAGIALNSRENVRHEATVFGMFVAAASRGTGLAAALLHAALTEARARPETSVVQLSVTKGNSAAERLYVRAGFESYGDEPIAVRTAAGFVTKVHMWRCLYQVVHQQGHRWTDLCL